MKIPGKTEETNEDRYFRLSRGLGFPYDREMSDQASFQPLFDRVERRTIRQKVSRPSLSYWQDAWIRLKKNKQALIALWGIVALVFFTLVGPLFWRHSHTDQDLKRVSETPTLFAPSAVVLSDSAAYEEIVVKDWPAAPTIAEGAGKSLLAPETLDVIGEASNQGVRLKWKPVVGASGYMVYRAEGTNTKGLGVPLGEVEGGNKVSYDDQFNLEAKTYYYSVVPKNVEESDFFVTRQVSVPLSISLQEAQAIYPDAKLGMSVPLSAYPLGTDYLGRDMLARLMEGARVSLFIGFLAPFLSTLIGVLVGGISGFAGGKLDAWMMRFTDFVLALPFLLFMILFKIAFGTQPGESGVFPMLASMVLLSWTTAARLTRGQVLQLREAEFVQASRLLGGSSWYLIWRHLLPNTVGVILVTLTFQIPQAIFTEAFLSFIGMGVAPPTPSWGSMCNDGIQTFLTHPHEFFSPAILISLTVLGFNRFGDGLRDALDPRLRSSD